MSATIATLRAVFARSMRCSLGQPMSASSCAYAASTARRVAVAARGVAVAAGSAAPDAVSWSRGGSSRLRGPAPVLRSRARRRAPGSALLALAHVLGPAAGVAAQRALLDRDRARADR